MPKIAYFYGIAVSMYYNDHAPPHFHAAYQGYKAQIGIEDGRVMAGRIPPTAARILRDWSTQRRDELMANWSRGERDAEFERVAGPDNDVGH